MPSIYRRETIQVVSEHRKAPAFNTQGELSVQLRIHAAHNTSRIEKLSAGRWFLIGQIILMALLGVACAGQYFRWYATVAFLPVLVRGFAWFAARLEALTIQALGKSELAYACAFGVLLVLGMRLP